MKRQALAPRRRPRQSRSTATVDAILEAAAEAFAREGYEAANVNRIAERAGASIGSLYQYFPSKEALVAALVERHSLAALDELDETIARGRDAPFGELVSEVVTRMVEVHRSPLGRMLAGELDTMGRIEAVEREVDARACAAVVALLESRGVRVPDRELSAFLLVRAVDELTHAALASRPAALDDGSLVRELCALVEGYLAHPRA